MNQPQAPASRRTLLSDGRLRDSNTLAHKEVTHWFRESLELLDGFCIACNLEIQKRQM